MTGSARVHTDRPHIGAARPRNNMGDVVFTSYKMGDVIGTPDISRDFISGDGDSPKRVATPDVTTSMTLRTRCTDTGCLPQFRPAQGRKWGILRLQ